jgi:hypothetical protein
MRTYTATLTTFLLRRTSACIAWLSLSFSLISNQQLQTTVFAARVFTPLRSLRALLHLLERGERYHFQHSTTKVYAIWYEHRYLLRRSLSIFSSFKPIGRCSFNSPSVSRLRQSFEFTGMSFDTSLARRPEDHGPSPRAVPAHRLTQPTTP